MSDQHIPRRTGSAPYEDVPSKDMIEGQRELIRHQEATIEELRKQVAACELAQGTCLSWHVHAPLVGRRRGKTEMEN